MQPLRAGSVETRDGAEQAPGVRHLGVVEQIALLGPLDDAARIHDDDLVGDVGDDAEVVGDQDHRRVEVLLQPPDQLDDLRLDRDVERGRRLVGDQHVGIARKRHRDHRALSHPAGELVREVVDARLRVRDADLLQKLDCPPFRRPLVDRLMRPDRLDDLIADPVDRVQRRHRILEDHPDLVAAEILHLRVRHLQQVATLVDHLSFEPSVDAPGEPHQRHRRDALARAGFADDPEHVAAIELEGDSVDGAHEAVFGREMDLEVLDLEETLCH
jgi:hypothetical protein